MLKKAADPEEGQIKGTRQCHRSAANNRLDLLANGDRKYADPMTPLGKVAMEA